MRLMFAGSVLWLAGYVAIGKVPTLVGDAAEIRDIVAQCFAPDATSLADGSYHLCADFFVGGCIPNATAPDCPDATCIPS
jgi:hypothetical protein